MKTDALTEKKFRQAILEGAKLMQEHGLGHWRIDLQNKRTSLADCNVAKKVIRYSKHFLKIADKDQFIGVTLHEIAHALLPVGAGHGPEFIALCESISPNSDYARAAVENVPVNKYTITCPRCGISGRLNRKKKRTICAKCLRKYNEEVSFVVEENVLEVKLW